MSTQTAVGRKSPWQQLITSICDTVWFQNLFALGLLGGGGLTHLAGLVGLLAWVAVVIAQVTKSRVELSWVGWLFTATALFLFCFDAAFAPATFEGGCEDETQRGLNWILAMSFICLLVTGASAYLILTGSVWTLTLVLVVPIFNLVLYAGTFIAVLRGI